MLHRVILLKRGLMKKKDEVDNKYEAGLGAFKEVLKRWWQFALLLIICGAVFFILQIKSLQCGDVVIQKEPVRVPLKK